MQFHSTGLATIENSGSGSIFLQELSARVSAGGGNPFCSIRRCCRKKGIESCAECEEFPCKRLEWISKRYRNWNVKNLKRIKEVGYKRWLKEKEEEVRKLRHGHGHEGMKRERKRG